MKSVPESYDVLGVPVSVVTMDSAATLLEQWSTDAIGRFVCVRDVASLVAISEDEEISPLHREASMIVPDGMPLVYLGRRQGLEVERVCGPDLFEEMMRRSPENSLGHFFFGGKDGVAEKLADRMRARFPGVRIVGCATPPFRAMTPAEQEDIQRHIRDSGADIVWVGLSSPKQDVWMWRNYSHLPQTLIGVGAAFDFHSGEVRRAPPWMQKTGLEWAYRISQEPKRLSRRYLKFGSKFLWSLALRRLAKKS
ncbi:WecB/TagA/CpsF family glycosyltransferase [Qipengyuania sp. RANM35]|uniref:WecB/TagA/CpsF family glycosyltransferase n=1 Tax=Qipengyuania sp. RANM35 TaxID=3068635 RepID=UPI0034DB5C2A